MSDVDTNEVERKYQSTKQRLSDLQEMIIDRWGWMQKFKNELAALKEQRPETPREIAEHRVAIVSKEQQINALQSDINSITARASIIAKILGISL